MKKCSERFVGVLEENIGQEMIISEYESIYKKPRAIHVQKAFDNLLIFKNIHFFYYDNFDYLKTDSLS